MTPKINNPKLVSELKHIFSSVDSRGAIKALQSMAERGDSTDVIEEISDPTLLIFGESNQVTNLDDAHAMQKIRNSELAVIKIAGHFSNLEQPRHFNEALLVFCHSIQF